MINTVTLNIGFKCCDKIKHQQNKLNMYLRMFQVHMQFLPCHKNINIWNVS